MNTEIATQTETETPVTVQTQPRRWSRPPVDLARHDDGWTAWLDVPGTSAERLSVTVDDGVLEVRAVRDAERGWLRRLALPDAVDVDAIEAQVEHGVLTLTLPKRESARPRSIPIR